MKIESLGIRNFRCIDDANIELFTDENWFVGPNASGKTSLLEAIYVLLRGGTFLSSRHGPLVRKGTDKALLGCRVKTEDGKSVRLSCSISGRTCQVRIDNAEVARQSLTEKAGVVRLFGANAQEIISGEPRIRRNFVDWNLFHVEPSYRTLLARYSRLLSQRNAALKSIAQPVSVWDAELCRLAHLIRDHREAYLNNLSPIIESLGPRLTGSDPPALSWTHGWPIEDDLAITLKRTAANDRRRGFTQSGPHRFTVTLTAGVRRLGSRGEQKLLAAAFHIACEKLYHNSTERRCIWLADDAASELTNPKGEQLINELRTTQGQMIFAGLTPPTALPEKTFNIPRLFHVERGTILN